MQNRRIVFYELNEVPFRIFDHFAHAMPGSALARLASGARRYETVSEDEGHLSPWTTWPTLHRGVTNAVHEIGDFGMDLSRIDREAPPVWDVLSRGGLKVGMFGSLHTHPLPDNVSDYGFYVPDTFAAGPECFPSRFEAFQEFNLRMVGMNGRNVGRSIALREAARFLAAAPGLGIRPRTVGRIARQLASERANSARAVRRRTSQVEIAFDFFMRALERERPDASFFFTNHAASSLHRYWPALFPGDYRELRYDTQWLEEWGGEIPFALREVDAQLSRLMRFVEANPDTSLVVASSMGQAAVEGREKVTHQACITNLRRFMEALGLAPEDWSKRPAMVPQYNVRIASARQEAFLAAVAKLSVEGQSLDVKALGEGVFRISFSLTNRTSVTAEFDGRSVDPATFGIANLHLQDAAGANAYHIPEGMLMVYDGTGTKSGGGTERISTTEVAPSILRNFGIEPRGYMQSGLAL